MNTSDDFDTEYDYDTWEPAMDQPSRYAFCDNYDVHEAHNYRALNTNHYECGGWAQVDADELEAISSQRCEHGMAAWLCSGPMHY